MSTLAPGSTLHPQRAPPPSLFLGPPSRNASNISLAPAAASPPSSSAPPRAPLLRTRSARGQDPSSTLGRSRLQVQTSAQTEGDRTDALWAEMQATLAEVELSAFNSTHVFGSAHSAALDELREAQIQLAQAWGRNEADNEKEAGNAADSQNNGDQGEESEGDDILVARKRREANEKFFQKIRDGVADVVGKLDSVAAAMSNVEKESRGIWSESDSVDSTNPSS
ncbi:MAG: hypothetical protein Q9167_007091 [Letrouitia subvulpina]